MVLNIFLGILGVFTLLFVESLLGAFLGFKLFFVIYIFLFGRIEWSKIFLLSLPVFLIFDVVYAFPLGTMLLAAVIPVSFLYATSQFFSLDSTMTAFLLRFATFFIYYISFSVLPSFLTSGEFGYFEVKDVGVVIVKSLVSAGLVFLFEYISSDIRNRGNTSRIRLK